MKSFFKSILASIIGCSIASLIGIICLFVFSVLFLFAIGISEKDYHLKDNSVLRINLEGVLHDRTSAANPLLSALDMDETNEIGLQDILGAIKKGKENPKIKGIYINSGILMASSASLQEIRNALLDFKTSGKFIIAYANTYTQGGYFVSSTADKVIMNPQGTLDLHGLSVSPTFYKGLLDKLGIEIQIFKVGTYKSAVEPFFLNEMSPANREQVNSFIGDIWGTLLGEISKSRGISVDSLNAITDSLPALESPSLIVKQKLVDNLMYESDVKKYINQVLGKNENSKIQFAKISDMRSVPYLTKIVTTDEIAVLYAEGDIMSGSGSEGIKDKYYIKKIEEIRDDDNIKAVVFRVNSPGGSANASEQIWKAISDLKQKKPVVVSMGDYAASGGYYISCNATKIFAEPTTLTGSIGIFGMFPNVEGLTQKVGLTFDNVKTNKFADFGDITRPMRPDEKVILQSYIDRGYDLFLTRCADGRHIQKDSLNLIAQGRVWTGKQALKIGLVDAIGGVDDAVKEAANLVHLKTYRLVSLPRKGSFWSTLLKTSKDDITTKLVKEYLGSDYELLKKMKDLKQQDCIQARLPYDFEVR